MKKNRENEPIQVIIPICMEIAQGKSLCSYLKQAKMSFFSLFFYKIGEQDLPGVDWYQWKRGEGEEMM
jgi:hypothetical protein